MSSFLKYCYCAPSVTPGNVDSYSISNQMNLFLTEDSIEGLNEKVVAFFNRSPNPVSFYAGHTLTHGGIVYRLYVPSKFGYTSVLATYSRLYSIATEAGINEIAKQLKPLVAPSAAPPKKII